MASFREQCVRCKKEFPGTTFVTKCDACGGLVDVEYDLKSARVHDGADMIDRYRDLVPVRDADNLVRFGAGGTPCLRAERLGKLLGLENLFLKDETKNPTGTTKARTASVVLSYFKERGVRHFTSSATGNSSTSFAVATIQNPPFEHSIFVGSRWRTRLTFDHDPRVHVWILDGASVTEAIAFSRRWEKDNGIPAEGGFFNMARREGLKLAYLEAVDHTGSAFDWYFQGVSTAMGAYGAFKGAREYLAMGRIDRLPRLGCMQEATCAPQVAAWKEASPRIEEHHIVKNPDGLADALLKSNPTDTYSYMYDVVKASNGLFESVTADEIREAQTALFEYEGIRACSASSTTIAGIRKLVGAGVLGKQERILANITGSDRDPDKCVRRYHRVVRAGDNWELAGEVIDGP